MKKTLKEYAIIIAVWIAISGIALLGSGCHALSPTGVYKSDQVIYTVELMQPTAHEIIGTFLRWEMNNAPVLKRWPEIHKSAEKMRNNAAAWFQTVNNLHDAYKLNPSKENKDKLSQALAVIQAALLEANGYMIARAVQPKPL